MASPTTDAAPSLTVLLSWNRRWKAVRRLARGAGIATKIGNHTLGATGFTATENGATLEKAANMADHASTRTTQLYDRRPDDIGLDEVDRIGV